MIKDLYKILGLPKEATKGEIKKRYYQLSKQYHPDKHVKSSDGEKERMTGRMAEISEAYKILYNVKTRSEYDKTGEMPSLKTFDQEVTDSVNIVLSAVLSNEDISETNIIRKCYKMIDNEITKAKDQILKLEKYQTNVKKILKIKGKINKKDSKSKAKIKEQFSYMIEDAIKNSNKQIEKSEHFIKVSEKVESKISTLEDGNDVFAQRVQFTHWGNTSTAGY